MKKVLGAFALSSLLFTGCASIVGNPNQTLPISSTPSEANIVIVDEKGKKVFKGITPTSVTLPKSDGSYWGGKSFTIEISKDGYATTTIPVKAKANGWYLAGNLVFGGLIGWFVIDPLSGSMYTLSPGEIESSLGDQTVENTGKDGSISIVLLQDVPEELRNKMTRVN